MPPKYPVPKVPVVEIRQPVTKRNPRGGGRPPAALPKRFQLRCTEDEFKRWSKYAKDKGLVFNDDGSPGPIVRYVMIAYIGSPEIRDLVREYYERTKQSPDGIFTARFNVRCTEAELESWQDRAKVEGYVLRTEGSPGPLIRRVVAAYMALPQLKDAVKQYHSDAGTPTE